MPFDEDVVLVVLGVIRGFSAVDCRACAIRRVKVASSSVKVRGPCAGLSELDPVRLDSNQSVQVPLGNRRTVAGVGDANLLASLSEVGAMTAISIRNLDSEVKAKLRIRAAQHGRSMEAEIRTILTDAVAQRPVGFFDAIRAVSLEHGGVDLDLRRHKQRQRPVDLR